MAPDGASGNAGGDDAENEAGLIGDAGADLTGVTPPTDALMVEHVGKPDDVGNEADQEEEDGGDGGEEKG